MAAAVETVPQLTTSTLLDLQLRRRDRKSRNFLLNLSSNESKIESAVSPLTSPSAPAPVEKPVPESKTPEQLAEELANWIKSMMNFDSLDLNCNDMSGKLTMSSLISKTAPSIEPYPSLDKFEYVYKGGRDKDKKFNGRGTLDFENGSYMSGEWKNGVREGKFKMDATDGSEVCYLEGFYTKDKINGKVRLQYSTGIWVAGYAKDSVLHGFCRYFNQNKTLTHLGMTRNGKLFGTCWKILPGGGYIVGKVDSEGEFTGPDIAYIYPDNRTAFHGIFQNGDMVKTQTVDILGFETEYNCIKVPIFSKPEGEFYKKEVSTTEWMTDNVFLEDPYEKRTVYITHSKLPGAEEGLFALRDLKCNTIAAFYNGLRRQRPANSASTWQLQDNAYKIFDPTNKHGVIDILPKYQLLANYCASLAHKTNHSFLPNCEFSEVIHPRWGLVPCVVTRQDVKQGEELLVSYGYDLDWCPDWYNDAWENSINVFLDSESSAKTV